MAKKVSKKKRQQQMKREAGGVGLIALGLFFAASMYSTAVGLLGAGVSELIFGLFGVASYALPVAFIAGGIAMIVTSKNKPKEGAVSVSLLGVMCILVLIHINARPALGDAAFLEYCRDAYEYGKGYHSGGGILGAMIAYPSLLLIGEAGSYILFIAGVVVVALVVTKLSLRSAGEKVGETIVSGLHAVSENRSKRQALYMAQLDEENEIEPLPQSRPKRRVATGRKKQSSNFLMEPMEQASNVPSEKPDPDFFPISGPIQKRSVNEQDPFGFDAVLEQNEATPLTDSMLHHPQAKSAVQEPLEFIPPHQKEVAPPPVSQDVIKPVPDPAVPAVPQDAALVYQRPPYTLLNLPRQDHLRGESPDKSKLLVDTLASFHISVKLLNVSVGPAITRYELQPAQGVRVNRITALSDDLALALAAPRVRIEAPIPGKAAIGIEVPNSSIATVLLREVIESPAFINAKSSITFALGKDIAGNIAISDLDRMPHLLIAGATGSGKSVCINDIIISMIYKSSPEDVRLILVDPKVVELKMFAVLPHLLVPVVTEPKKAAGALRWAVLEMEQRYQKMAKLNTRSLSGYNSMQERPEDRMPKIVIIIDELADLMMVAAKEVEESICRIAQLGRACGIHLIVATQRPSADIITGLIKANIPSRIAFAVSSSIDSRVILDATGAEKLLGRGDMLFHANGAGKPVRIQGAFVSDEEVERIAEFFSDQQAAPVFNHEVLEEIATSTVPGAQGGGKQEDELLGEAVKVLLECGQASISMVQRRLRVGYARAARLIDIMEQKRIVSPGEGSKPRKLLIDYAQYEQMFGSAAQGQEEEEF